MGYRYGFQVTSFCMFVIELLFWIVVRPVKQSHTTIKAEEQVSI
ncbi:hypothetical protein ACQVPL_12745 [Bacillus hominis]